MKLSSVSLTADVLGRRNSLLMNDVQTGGIEYPANDSTLKNLFAYFGILESRCCIVPQLLLQLEKHHQVGGKVEAACRTYRIIESRLFMTTCYFCQDSGSSCQLHISAIMAVVQLISIHHHAAVIIMQKNPGIIN